MSRWPRFFWTCVLILVTAGCAPAAANPQPGPTSQPGSTAQPAATQRPQVPPGQPAAVKLVQSQKGRSTPAQPNEEDLQTLVKGQTQFALDLYRALRSAPDNKGSVNLFASPYSISEALAMTYAGARGKTADEMAAALHFTLPQERLHPANNSLEAILASRAKPQNKDEKGFQLNIANSLWGQDGYPFQADFLDLLAENYAAGMRLVDFKNSPEPARLAINQWVDQQTQQKIKDLVPQGAIDESTRLVLANAIYFKAAWLSPFKKEDTQQKPFTLDSGQTIQVPMMQQSSSSYGYGKGDGWQAVELPYEGGKLSMVVLLPDAGKLGAFEDSLDAAKLETILSSVSDNTVNLGLPRFSFVSSFGLVEPLRSLGMKDAFDPSQADFSGMDGARDLYIGNVLHKAFVAVDEAGTEAAAATAVIMSLTAAPAEPVTVTVDHPFLFLIRDQETGAVLFLGRVANPQ